MDERIQAVVRRTKQQDFDALSVLPDLLERCLPTSAFGAICLLLACLGFKPARRVADAHFPMVSADLLDVADPARLVELVRLIGGDQATLGRIAREALDAAAAAKLLCRDNVAPRVAEALGWSEEHVAYALRNSTLPLSICLPPPPARLPRLFLHHDPAFDAAIALCSLRSAPTGITVDDLAMKCLEASCQLLSSAVPRPLEHLGVHLASRLLIEVAEHRATLPFSERTVVIDVGPTNLVASLHTRIIGPQRPLFVPLPTASSEDEPYWTHQTLLGIEATTFVGLDYLDLDRRLAEMSIGLPRSLAGLAGAARRAARLRQLEVVS